jgi:hypothetical protein
MRPRHAVLALALVLGHGLANAQGGAETLGFAWDKTPGVVVLSAEGDPRAPAVTDAVDYWNRALAALGTPFRLGPVSHRVGAIPAEELRALSAAILGGTRPEMPASVRAVPGDLVLALSDADLVSFSIHWRAERRGLVAIRSPRLYPLTLPNVPRNLIAHELGHALGLGHNADPQMLMCGRPAPCRPDIYRSDTERFFPLTDRERALLRQMYPEGWKSRD